MANLYSVLVNEEVAASKFASFKIALDTAWADLVSSPSVTVIRQDRYISQQGLVAIHDRNKSEMFLFKIC